MQLVYVLQVIGDLPDKMEAGRKAWSTIAGCDRAMADPNGKDDPNIACEEAATEVGNYTMRASIYLREVAYWKDHYEQGARIDPPELERAALKQGAQHAGNVSRSG